MNSQHQLWSRWDVTVTPPKAKRRRFTDPANPAARRSEDDLRTAWAKFVRKAFATTAGQVRLERKRMGPFGLFGFELFAQARVEGVPAHDPVYRDRLKQSIVTFFGSGYGPGTRVHVEVRIEAGDQQDGAPPSQIVVLPTLVAGANHALVPVNVAGPEALPRGEHAVP